MTVPNSLVVIWPEHENYQLGLPEEPNSQRIEEATS